MNHTGIISAIAARILIRSILPILIFSCAESPDTARIYKKHMPDISYVYIESDDPTADIESGIARSLELYALYPLIFGDPIGIITEFSDSLNIIPANRNFGVILTDNEWQPPEGVNSERIPGGNAVVCQCSLHCDSLESCWKTLAEFVRSNGYIPILPGIEIYRGFGTETTEDSLAAELIIRIEPWKAENRP